MPQGRKEKFNKATDKDGTVTLLRKGSKPDKLFKEKVTNAVKSTGVELTANQEKSIRTKAAGDYAKSMGKINNKYKGFGYLP